MTTELTPVFRTERMMLLAGMMAVYTSQAEASEKIPAQWREFLSLSLPEIDEATELYGASPCTDDGKIHYLCGIMVSVEEELTQLTPLTLEGGEYAVFTVNSAALRDTWIWALSKWLPASGRKERNAPEFERYIRSSAVETCAQVEIWIPLEPV